MNQVGWNNNWYDFASLEFHRPSEHAIDGEHSDLEVSFRFIDPNGYPLIASVLCNEQIWGRTGGEDPWLEELLQDFAQLNWQTDRRWMGQSLDIGDFLVAKNWKKYYHYDGSLSYPPCTENVPRIILGDKCVVSDTMATVLNRFPSMHNNIRELQTIHGRHIDTEYSHISGASQNSKSTPSNTGHKHWTSVLIIILLLLMCCICCIIGIWYYFNQKEEEEEQKSYKRHNQYEQMYDDEWDSQSYKSGKTNESQIHYGYGADHGTTAGEDYDMYTIHEDEKTVSRSRQSFGGGRLSFDHNSSEVASMQQFLPNTFSGTSSKFMDSADSIKL